VQSAMNCLRDPTVAEMSSTEGSKLISSHVASDGNVYPVQTVNVKNVKIINFNHQEAQMTDVVSTKIRSGTCLDAHPYEVHVKGVSRTRNANV